MYRTGDIEVVTTALKRGTGEASLSFAEGIVNDSILTIVILPVVILSIIGLIITG